MSAIFAVWLALVMGEASFVHHRCPMHDGPLPPAPANGDAHASTGHSAHHGHGGSTGHGHHVCTCIGACSASGGDVALTQPAELPTVVIAFVATPAPRAAGEPGIPRHPPFTLPFANGPPGAIA